MTDAMSNAEPMPGSEYDVPAQFATCAHCSQTIARVGNSAGWTHRGSGKMACNTSFVNLSDIRAERGKGKGND